MQTPVVSVGAGSSSGAECWPRQAYGPPGVRAVYIG